MLSGWISLSIAVVIAGVLRCYYVRFRNMLEADRRKLLLQCCSRCPGTITKNSIQHLPAPVKLWLTRSGVLNRAFDGTVHLFQQGKMRTTNNGRWMPVKAEQWFSPTIPAFLWAADVNMFPLLHLAGKDRYINGKGHMLISILSAIPVVNARGPEINQGSIVRYLAEIAWFPYAAVSEYITWEEVDALTARATITYGGISASALFSFNEEGDIVSIKAKRYYSQKGKATLEDWLVETAPHAYRKFEGIRVPDRLQVTWLPEHGRFTWFLLKVTDIRYHEKRTYTRNKLQHHGHL